MDDRFFVKKQKLALAVGRQFEALDQNTKETVLIHRFAKGDSDKKDIWRDVFNRHAEKLERLKSPSLPDVIAHGVDDQGPHLILKEQKGLRLSDVVNCGPMMIASVRQMAEQMLQAYAVAAAEGVYHTALNPMLVLVGESEGEGNLFQFTDMGYAEVHNDIQGEDGRVLGDPAFLSPRQLRGEEQDEIGCLFSLGQLCYYCLAGGHPFGGMSLPAILSGYEAGELPSVEQFRADIPADLVQWLNGMIAVDRGQRFQSINDALAALPVVQGLEAIPMDMSGVVSVKPTSATGPQAVMAHNRPKLITGPQAIRPATGSQPAVVGAQPTTLGSVSGTVSVQPSLGGEAEKKKKIILFSSIGGGVLLLLIIILIAVNGGDDKPADSSTVKEEPQAELDSTSSKMDEETRELFRDFAYGWDFNNDLLPINVNRPKIRILNDVAYGEGVDRKSLILGPLNFYQIPQVEGAFIEKYGAATISLWVKVPGQWSGAPVVITNRKYNLPGSTGWPLTTVPGDAAQMKFRFSSYDGKVDRVTDSSLLVTADRWHLFTVVMKNGVGVKFYQDGILVGEQDVLDTSALHTGKGIFIGTDEEEKAYFDKEIEIDQLYIWHRDLSGDDVKKLYEDKSVYIP